MFYFALRKQLGCKIQMMLSRNHPISSVKTENTQKQKLITSRADLYNVTADVN